MSAANILAVAATVNLGSRSKVFDTEGSEHRDEAGRLQQHGLALAGDCGSLKLWLQSPRRSFLDRICFFLAGVGLYSWRFSAWPSNLWLAGSGTFMASRVSLHQWLWFCGFYRSSGTLRYGRAALSHRVPALLLGVGVIGIFKLSAFTGTVQIGGCCVLGPRRQEFV